MTDSNTALTDVPSAWSAYLPILAGVFRALLAALGAAGFTWAQTVSGSQIEMAAGAALMLSAAVWSAWQKIQAIRASQRESVASAVASAQATQSAGVPVAVVVGPGPATETAIAAVQPPPAKV